MSERSTAINALVGAVVTLVISFVPFSPLLGGAVAGYLEREDGLRVGALSGAMATLPLLLVALGGVFFVPMMGMGGGLRMVLFVVVGFVVAGLYAVGLSAVGGLAGVSVADARAAKRERSGRNGEERVEDEPVAP